MLAITEGRRPPRPTHPAFTDNLWALMQRCWNQDPHLRPEVSEAVQVLLTPLVSYSLWQSCTYLLNRGTVGSDLPAWKRLTSFPLSVHERTALITSIFSERDKVEVVGNLSRDDAQAFIDVIDEVDLPRVSHLKGKPADFGVIRHIRHWIAWHQ